MRNIVETLVIVFCLGPMAAVGQNYVAPDTVAADQDGFFSFEGEYTVGPDTLLIEYSGHHGIENVDGGIYADCFCLPFCQVEPNEEVLVYVWGSLLDPELPGSVESFIYFCSRQEEGRDVPYSTVIVPYGTPVSGIPELGRKPILGDAYPNPFNPRTTIDFEIPQPMMVSLRIFDVSGQLIAEMISGEIMTQGHHEIEWNGCDDSGFRVASGTYFYHLDAGKFSDAKQMTLIK